MSAEDRSVMHPDALELSAYLDGALAGADRARVEAHLSGCAECRREVAAVAGVLRTAPRRVTIPWGLATAAILALLLVPSLDLPQRLRQQPYREPAVTTTAAPVAIEPRGAVDSARALVWSAVPHASRYRLALLDSAGTVVWRLETTDTIAALPDTVRLRAGASYFWKVDAETGFDRWVGSELVDFTIARPNR